MTQVRITRDMLTRSVLVFLVVGLCAWLALDGREAEPVLESEDEVSPLPSAEPRCRFSGREALAHAGSLEQMATARWERVPFALHEAPRAALQMAEAEACYEAGGERAGRMRSAGKRRGYEEEVLRRFARARLLLRAATMPTRPSGAAEGEARQDEQARRQVATLLALLERAPESAQPFRQELVRLDRAYAARAAERTRGAKEE